jgi:hypothetical protein
VKANNEEARRYRNKMEDTLRIIEDKEREINAIEDKE